MPRFRNSGNISFRFLRKQRYAGVAELADAHGSGPCGGYPMKVQVLSPAPFTCRRAPRRELFSFEGYPSIVPGLSFKKCTMDDYLPSVIHEQMKLTLGQTIPAPYSSSTPSSRLLLPSATTNSLSASSSAGSGFSVYMHHHRKTALMRCVGGSPQCNRSMSQRLDCSLPALLAKQLLARKSFPEQAHQVKSVHTFRNT